MKYLYILPLSSVSVYQCGRRCLWIWARL